MGYLKAHMSNWISSGMGTGGIPTTDNIPDNLLQCLKKSAVVYIVGWAPEFFSGLGYIVSYGYPIRTHTHTRGNSVAHVCLKAKHHSSLFHIGLLIWSSFLTVSLHKVKIVTVSDRKLGRRNFPIKWPNANTTFNVIGITT